MNKVLGARVPSVLMGSRMAGVMAAVLMLSACGGGDSGDTDASAETEGGLTSITVLRSPASGFESLYVAQDEGIFEKHGLEVEIIEGGAPQESMPLLVNGQVQIAMSDLASVTTAISQGIPVAATFPVQAALEGQNTSGLWVQQDSPIQSVADLEGANVAMPGSGGVPHVSTMYAMEEEGVDPTAMTVVDIPIPAQAEALAAGDIDAAFLIGAFHYGAAGMGPRYLSDTTVDYMPGTAQIVWAASKQYTQENADVIEAFNAALEETYEFANEDVESRRNVMREVTELPEEYIADVELPAFQFSFDREATQTFVEAMAEFGFVDSAPSLDELFAEQAPVE